MAGTVHQKPYGKVVGHAPHVHVHEKPVGLSSTTNPKPRGIPPSACSGTSA